MDFHTSTAAAAMKLQINLEEVYGLKFEDVTNYIKIMLYSSKYVCTTIITTSITSTIITSNITTITIINITGITKPIIIINIAINTTTAIISNRSLRRL